MFSKFSNIFSGVRFPAGRRDRDPGGGGDRGHGRSPPVSSPSQQGSSSKKSRPSEGPATGGDDDVQTCQVDNSQAVIAKIAMLYAERLMNDITLVINEKEYAAHRLILCASSDVFQVMLMNPNWSEARESRVVLQESTECAEVFEDFLKYLYTGLLKLELSTVLHVLVLADKYNVKDLITLCLTYMQVHIPSAAAHNQLVLWFQYTWNFGCQHVQVAKCCRNYIKWNLDMVSKAEDFPHLELDLFLSILSEDDIVVFDENHLFQIVEYWLMCRLEAAAESMTEMELLRIVDLTMQHIRFPMMTPRQIADLIQDPITRNSKLLMERMALGMQFHNGCLEQTPMLTSQGTVRKRYLCDVSNPDYKMFTPRLYCTDQWSVCIVAPFDRLQHYQSQSLVFATPSSFSELISNSDKQVEWYLDFFPKAVQFQRFCVIGWHGTTELPEKILKTVRLSILCRSEEIVRVHIGILIAGLQDGIEHVRKVINKRYIFSARDGEQVLNIDNLLPYGDLNPCAECVTRARLRSENSTFSPTVTAPRQANSSNSSSNANNLLNQLSSTSLSQSFQSDQCSPTDETCSFCKDETRRNCFFIGNNADTLKVRIVITQLP